MNALMNAFERLDLAQKALDDYVSSWYAPYQLDEPITKQDEHYNARYYSETRRLAADLNCARKEVISCARNLLTS